MKISIIGYSGSGKSTLARNLSELYAIPALHLDRVHFLPGWQERPEEEKKVIVQRFLDENDENGWVIDGNYKALSYSRRMKESDKIIILALNRFVCLKRAYGRYLTYRGRTREDMGEGCNEKFDWEFFTWIMWEGRSRAKRQRHRRMAAEQPNKVVLLKSQRQIDKFFEKEKENR